MHLPHVVPFTSWPIYFFTMCTAARRELLANDATLSCLTELWTRAKTQDGWFVGRFVLIPDHVHFFAMRPAMLFRAPPG